jgi:transcriptional regulator with XRE-family HTH domain
MTVEQVKAARALLGWNQERLAEASGVSVPTIARLEAMSGPLSGYAKTRNAIRSALEAAGIEFLETGAPSLGGGAGVRLRGNA